MPRVLVTGANRGIGLEFARQYSADGWDVIATARETSAELAELGVRVERLDLRDLDAVLDELTDAVIARLDVARIDALAGGPPPGDQAGFVRA